MQGNAVRGRYNLQLARQLLGARYKLRAQASLGHNFPLMWVLVHLLVGTFSITFEAAASFDRTGESLKMGNVGNADVTMFRHAEYLSF